MMSEYISNKLRILSLFLIILVLFIHSPFTEAIDIPLNNFIQDLISGKIGRLAVPLFFMISGFLFFYNIGLNKNIIYSKIRKRFYTIVIPYLLGSLFFLLFYLTLSLIPAVKGFINGNILTIFENSPFETFKKVFWINEGNYPLAFHLWFLRDLIITLLFTPLLYFLFRNLGFWTILLVFSFSLIPMIPSTIPTSLFWFSFGGIVCYKQVEIELPIHLSTNLCLLVTYLFFSYCGFSYTDSYLLKPIIFLGILFIWSLYDVIYKINQSFTTNKLISFLCSFTFFIYVYHEPTLNIIKKLFINVFGKSSGTLLIAYIFTPFIYVLLSTFVGHLTKKFIPRTYNFLVGGRI